MSTTGMVKYEGDPMELTQWRDPEQVLAEATKAAEALGRVIALKKNPVIFNKEQYLELEDWQTVGKFYGITTKVLETRHVEYGGVTGWEAVAVAIRSSDGMEVSRAESMCMTDEKNWGSVPVYEWQDVLVDGKKVWDQTLRNGKGGYKSNRVQTGVEAKPTFQLRSMAQTRACGKAFRQVLSWVVVLGGFKPNVAEEMIESQLGPEETQQKESKPPVTQPTRKSEAVLEEISGKITQSKFGKNGALWCYIGDKLVAVDKQFINDDMVEGGMLAVKAKKMKNASIPEFWGTMEIIATALPQDEVEEGEIVDGEVESDAAEPEEAKTTSLDGGSPAAASLKELFNAGAVKPASQIESDPSKATKPGTIGVKRAQRIHIIITQSHKTTGFTEAELKKLMDEFKLEHLRDLPVEHYKIIEGYAQGTDTRWKD